MNCFTRKTLVGANRVIIHLSLVKPIDFTRKTVIYDTNGLPYTDTRDIIREGDSDAMDAEWRLYMSDYHNNPPHLQSGSYVTIFSNIQILVAYGNTASDEIRLNRTINDNGGVGKNIPVDLYNEFMNRSIKCEYHSKYM